MLPTQITWPVSSTTAIAALQTLGAAGAMTLNGPLSGPTTRSPVGQAQMPDSFNRKLTLTSTGNISGVSFTIVGTDYDGNAVTEALAGPNNNTVTSVNNYFLVTSVTANAAVATNTSIGTGSTGVTAWVITSDMNAPASVGLYIQITATMSVTVEGTPDFPIGTSPGLFPHAVLAAITSSDSSEWPYPVNGVRFKVNSSDATGAAVFSVLQAGF